MDNLFQNIIASSLVLVFFVFIFVVGYYFISAKSLKKRREHMKKLQDSIKPGKKVMFSGGLVGRVVKAGDEYIDVELNKGTIVTISRFGIQEIVE